MKRKIVQHGSSSLTVTLPVKWADKYKLKKGDELNVEESGSSLLISTANDVSVNKKVVSTSDSGIFTKNNLSHLYQLGYDEIEITFDDSKTLDDIKKRIAGCIGYEIIDQKDNKVYIKCIATTLETEFDTLLRKSFQITNEMAKSMISALENNQCEKLKEIRDMESLNNKFTDTCIRILNKKGYSNQKRTMQMYEVVKNIERIADEFKYICDLLSSCKKQADKTIINLFKEAVDYYLAFYEMFYKFDPKLKKKIYEERKSLTEKYKTLAGKNPALMHHLINTVEKTYEGAGGYFALTL
jgi:phosphate uptake regulator